MASRNDNKKEEREPRGDEKKIPGGPEVPDSLDTDISKSNQDRLQEDDMIFSDTGPAALPEETPGDRNSQEEKEELDIVMGTEADVTEEDLQMLGDPERDMDMGEDEQIRSEGLDDTDFDGDPLNEGASDVFTTGDDLDMPANDGSDPLADSMGQGDEENDYYSLGDNDDGNPENA